MKTELKLLALLLSLVMALSFGTNGLTEAADEATDSYVSAPDGDYTGKTIILHSNDVHGAIEGYAFMACLKNDYLAKGASDVIVVDAGDFSQGTPYVSASKGASAVELMNAVGYDVAALGNHEFDYGYAQLSENLGKAEFAVLCCNVFFAGTNETPFAAGAVFTAKNELNIGFVGIETPETTTKVNPGLVAEFDFAASADMYAAVQETVNALRDMGADIVIALSHLGIDAESAGSGNRSIDLYANTSGIDFIIDGHSHTVMDKGENGEPIQSTGTKFACIGVIVIDDETKTIEENHLLSTVGMGSDPAVAAAAQAIIDEVDALYGAVFAVSEVELNGDKAPGNRTEETNLGDLITDAMLWKVVSEGGDEQFEPNQVICIVNGGGIRASIAAGDVTMNDIYSAWPSGDSISVIYVTGAELLEALEASTFCTPDPVGAYPQTSGIVWTLDTTKEYDAQDSLYVVNDKESTYYGPKSINRVTIESINGEPFDINATYAVVTNNFCAAGGDTYAVFYRAYSEGSGFDTGIPMDEAVVEYIEEVLGGVIGEEYAAPQGRETQIQADAANDAA